MAAKIMANCPNCNGEQNCPCENCKDRSAGKVVWKWIDGEFIQCGHCNHTMHVDEWNDLDYEEFKQKDVI